MKELKNKIIDGVIGIGDLILCKGILSSFKGNTNKSVLNKFRQLLVIKHKVYPLINTAVYDELKKNYPEQWEKVNNFRQSRINNIIELLNDGVRAGEVVPIKDGVLKIMLNNLFDEAVDEKVLLENNITYADVVNSLVEILINGLAKK